MGESEEGERRQREERDGEFFSFGGEMQSAKVVVLAVRRGRLVILFQFTTPRRLSVVCIVGLIYVCGTSRCFAITGGTIRNFAVGSPHQATLYCIVVALGAHFLFRTVWSCAPRRPCQTLVYFTGTVLFAREDGTLFLCSLLLLGVR